jgi:hypothetical protein
MTTSSVPTMDVFPSLAKFLTLCEPKSVGASLHPDKWVVHFGSQILAMSRSYESVLDDIAEYLRFISKAQSFGFTQNSSDDHGGELWYSMAATRGNKEAAARRGQRAML